MLELMQNALFVDASSFGFSMTTGVRVDGNKREARATMALPSNSFAHNFLEFMHILPMYVCIIIL